MHPAKAFRHTNGTINLLKVYQYYLVHICVLWQDSLHQEVDHLVIQTSLQTTRRNQSFVNPEPAKQGQVAIVITKRTTLRSMKD